MRYIVKIIDTPERIHREHCEKISAVFEPNFKVYRTLSNEYEIQKVGDHWKIGTFSLDKNNKDVTIDGDQTQFIDIANEIEKLGYSVTIID